MKINDPGRGTESANENLPAAKDWYGIIKLAWRPAWSMHSRKGGLAPFIAW